jgi:hypothetical protein
MKPSKMTQYGQIIKTIIAITSNRSNHNDLIFHVCAYDLLRPERFSNGYVGFENFPYGVPKFLSKIGDSYDRHFSEVYHQRVPVVVGVTGQPNECPNSLTYTPIE